MIIFMSSLNLRQTSLLDYTKNRLQNEYHTLFLFPPVFPSCSRDVSWNTLLSCVVDFDRIGPSIVSGVLVKRYIFKWNCNLNIENLVNCKFHNKHIQQKPLLLLRKMFPINWQRRRLLPVSKGEKILYEWAHCSILLLSTKNDKLGTMI